MNSRWTFGEVSGRSFVLPLIAAVLTSTFVAVVALVHLTSEVEAAEVLMDTSAVTGVPPWTGLGAALSVCLWAVAAALALFVSELHPATARDMGLFAGLSLLLMMDDLLLLHEAAETLAGVPNVVFFLPYALAAATLAWRLRFTRTGAAGWVLLAAGAALGASILVDVLVGGYSSREMVLEDGLKLVGAAVWACVPVVLHRVRSADATPEATAVEKVHP